MSTGLPVLSNDAKIFSSICGDVGLRGNFRLHSLWITWEHHARLLGVVLAHIMYKLNHANLSITKRYLGNTGNEPAVIIKTLNFKCLTTLSLVLDLPKSILALGWLVKFLVNFPNNL